MNATARRPRGSSRTSSSWACSALKRAPLAWSWRSPAASESSSKDSRAACSAAGSMVQPSSS
eukprot:scaffold62727_cov62-Phaeocystis_antarctica.AAC.8